MWSSPGRDVPVVIYTDGSCALSDEPKTLIVNPQLEDSDAVLWSGHAQDEESCVFVTVFENKVCHTLFTMFATVYTGRIADDMCRLHKHVNVISYFKYS